MNRFDEQKIAAHLGVDEVRVANGLASTKVAVRIGAVWREATVDFESVKDAAGLFARVLMELSDAARAQVEQLVRRMSLETATGADLDRAAGLVPRDGVRGADGVVFIDEYDDLDVQRPASRFEAIVMELAGAFTEETAR